MNCPKCGSSNLQVTNEIETHGKDFSATQGCLGWLMFGPLGILCGKCGQNKKVTSKSVWKCVNCGTSFKDIETLRGEIKDAKVNIGAMMFLAAVCVIGGIIAAIACIADGEALIGIGIGLGMIVIFGGMSLLGALSCKKQGDAAKAELKQNFNLDE